MHSLSAKIISVALVAAGLSCVETVLSPSLMADEGLGVGACVTVVGMPSPGRVIRLTPGGYVVQAEGKSASDALNWSRSRVSAGPCGSAAAPAPGPHSCPEADAANLGATQQGQRFLTAIRAVMNHPASPGMDGAVTVTFQSFQVGAGRGWTILDSRNFSADQRQPIYDVRTGFTTCTDFRTAIELRQQVSNFQCFTSPTGQTACQMSGTVNGMPGPTQRIAK
jgi:hypothetical protein